jgi:hypothetical protein
MGEMLPLVGFIAHTVGEKTLKCAILEPVLGSRSMRIAPSAVVSKQIFTTFMLRRC